MAHLYALQGAMASRSEAALLTATKEIISTQGIKNLAMIDIADLSQVSRATLYNHFRDKDAVSSCALMAEIAAWAIDQGKTLYELLQDIYLEYGFSKEKLKSVVRKGKTGAEEIEQIMVGFRNNPPKELGGSPMEWVKDYSTNVAKNLITGEEKKIDQTEQIGMEGSHPASGRLEARLCRLPQTGC